MISSLITFCNGAVELINSHTTIKTFKDDSGFGINAILNLGIIESKNDIFINFNPTTDNFHFTYDGELKLK